MDKITFRNQIENLNSLTTRYNELANDLRESLTENQKEFFDEHLGDSLDFLNNASSNPAISALKFKQEDIDKMRIVYYNIFVYIKRWLYLYKNPNIQKGNKL